MKVIRVKSRLGWDTHESYPVVEGWCTSCATYEANMAKVEKEALLFANSDEVLECLIAIRRLADRDWPGFPLELHKWACDLIAKSGGKP